MSAAGWILILTVLVDSWVFDRPDLAPPPVPHAETADGTAHEVRVTQAPRIARAAAAAFQPETPHRPSRLPVDVSKPLPPSVPDTHRRYRSPTPSPSI